MLYSAKRKEGIHFWLDTQETNHFISGWAHILNTPHIAVDVSWNQTRATSVCQYTWFYQHNSRSSRLLATTVVVVYQSYYVSCFVQSNPWQTDTQTISTRSKRIPRTTNLIFMFCNQVFLRIFTPCFLNSWAWITYIQHRLIMHAGKEKQHDCYFEFLIRDDIYLTMKIRSFVLEFTQLFSTVQCLKIPQEAEMKKL